MQDVNNRRIDHNQTFMLHFFYISLNISIFWHIWPLLGYTEPDTVWELNILQVLIQTYIPTVDPAKKIP